LSVKTARRLGREGSETASSTAGATASASNQRMLPAGEGEPRSVWQKPRRSDGVQKASPVSDASQKRTRSAPAGVQRVARKRRTPDETSKVLANRRKVRVTSALRKTGAWRRFSPKIFAYAGVSAGRRRGHTESAQLIYPMTCIQSRRDWRRERAPTAGGETN
jgi:hypothetical protein